MAELTSVDRRIIKYRKTGTGFKREQALFNSHHIAGWFDDFQGDALDGKYTIVEGGTGDSVSIVAGTVNGVALIDSGSDDNNSASLELGLHYKGDLNCVVETRVLLEAITDCKFVFGFTDALFATDAAGPVNILATPSMTATDAAVWVLDTDDVGNGALQAIAVKTNTIFSGDHGSAVAIEPSVGVPTSDAVPLGPTFAVAEFLTLTVACRGDDVRFIAQMDAGDIAADGTDEPYFDSGWVENGIDGSKLLTPFIQSVTRNAGAGNFAHADYIDVYQSRV